ncbi:MAG TPA: hypothetical protein VIV11_32650 [Kofleriaceae bacterium]
MRALIATLLVVAACDAYDEDLGPAPFFCGQEDPVCPSGYSCVDDPTNGTKVCVSDDDSISGNFECEDDSALEPNDMLAAATTITASYTVDTGAICPAGDRDLYAITMSADGANLEATITYAGGAVLRCAILNTGGVPIANATEVGGEDRTLRATAADLPSGQYYVQVTATPAGTLAINNYELSVTAN